ncbi:MAG TPA: septal ring lytic transglycosylase RlpA family protein [Trueperaceae bacterium]|nr:septal ring lytic transglycosylase RlpA family protein [Trueperaceae bacterium]
MLARGSHVSPRPLSIALAACALALAACAPSAVRTDTTPTALVVETEAPPFTSQVGEASWYGPGFAGRQTANGEVFDPSELTAAHKELPFDTLVRVHNQHNGRSVVVRINDRGPFKPGRIIDLSRAAAEAIGMVGSGVAHVRLEVLTLPAGMVRVAALGRLTGYEAISRTHPIGTLLVLDAGTRKVVVRVVSQEVPAGTPADLLVGFDLFAEVGSEVLVLSDR